MLFGSEGGDSAIRPDDEATYHKHSITTPFMEKIKLTLQLLLIAIFSFGVTSCTDDEEKDLKKQQEEACYYRYWKEYPQSYIKMCDWRLTFRFTKCERVEGGLYIQYVMTNTGFDKKVQISFWMPSSAAHDDLGNTYVCSSQGHMSDVKAMIDGKSFAEYGWGRDVIFMPNQAIKGSFMIKDFDQNATAVSVSCHTRLSQPSGESLMYEHIEFVNLPIDEDFDHLERL